MPTSGTVSTAWSRTAATPAVSSVGNQCGARPARYPAPASDIRSRAEAGVGLEQEQANDDVAGSMPGRRRSWPARPGGRRAVPAEQVFVGRATGRRPTFRAGRTGGPAAGHGWRGRPPPAGGRRGRPSGRGWRPTRPRYNCRSAASRATGSGAFEPFDPIVRVVPPTPAPPPRQASDAGPQGYDRFRHGGGGTAWPRHSNAAAGGLPCPPSAVSSARAGTGVGPGEEVPVVTTATDIGLPPATPATAEGPLVHVATPARPRWLHYGDHLRILGTVAVVVGHVADMTLYQAKPLSATWWTCNWWDAACRWAVPVYIMLSGSLLLDPARGEPPGVFYRKRLARLGRAAGVLVGLLHVGRRLLHRAGGRRTTRRTRWRSTGRWSAPVPVARPLGRAVGAVPAAGQAGRGMAEPAGRAAVHAHALHLPHLRAVRVHAHAAGVRPACDPAHAVGDRPAAAGGQHGRHGGQQFDRDQPEHVFPLRALPGLLPARLPAAGRRGRLAAWWRRRGWGWPLRWRQSPLGTGLAGRDATGAGRRRSTGRRRCRWSCTTSSARRGW